MKIFNTLSRLKEEFVPLVAGSVGMYTCGPTVYDYAHIGNFRAFVFYDILSRYLRYKGFKVKHIMNLTDIDDKTIRGSRLSNMSLKAFTEKYSACFFEDLDTLGVLKAEKYPKATDYIKDMVKMIDSLLDRGFAYSNPDGVYFDVFKLPDYGKLSGIKLSEMKKGERVLKDEYEKGNVQDFALWKAYDPEDGNVFWETQVGKGRPGWHIECSAMSRKLLGSTFDIHCGGIDLIFPHHENEIAQSAGCGDSFAKYWMHNEHILVNGQKMSKSLGNFFTLRDLLARGYDAKSIRYSLLSSHYRQKLNFTFEGISSAGVAVSKLNEFYNRVLQYSGAGQEDLSSEISLVVSTFEHSMDDDLNISSALGAIFEFMHVVNKHIDDSSLRKKDATEIIKVFDKFNTVLNVIDKVSDIDFEIKALISEREKARVNKDFKTSDKIRDHLKALGIVLYDTPNGVRWKKA